ncbi:MAG: hypothetical protein ABI894_04935 [Ilumatobacteraceae bacterium]
MMRDTDHTTDEITDDRDRGAALILALVMMLVGAMIVLPTLSYTMAVTRHSRVAMNKTASDELVKGGLRTALAEPGKLYAACQGGSRTTVHTIASGIPNVSSTCSWLSERQERDATTISYSVATLQAGSGVPADAVPQTAPASWYAASGNMNYTAWLADQTPTSTADKIWLPNLPSHALSHPSSIGYDMPTGFAACTVYFPGTYTNAVAINSSSKPTFFTSGIYYFENTVTISGNAQVVVGDGGVDGCTTDQEAAFSAVGAPTSHNITGVGATFVFGAGGRLIINDVGTTTGLGVKFNKRYVGSTDVNTASSASVSIMSVNGTYNGSANVDLDLPNQLFVPASQVQGASTVPATSPNNKPSTNVSSANPLLPAPPMVDISLTSLKPVSIAIPGYVSVPQGTINVSTLPTATAAKDVQIIGGVLSAQIILSTDRPATFQFGAINAVVQKTFKIVSVSSTDRSKSTAIVQVNSIGTYYVNSWEVQTS